MEEKISGLYAQFREAAECVYLNGWAEANAGNMSIRLELDPNIDMSEEIKLPESFPSLKNISFLVTASGSRMRHVKEDPGKYICAVRIGSDGKSLFYNSRNGLRPTSEIAAHLSIHDILLRTRPEFKALLHCHTDYLTALAGIDKLRNDLSLTQALSSAHTEVMAVIPQGAGFISRLEPGSQELAAALGEKFGSKDIVLLEAHGSFAAGTDLTAALDITEVAEKAAKLYIIKHNLRK